MWSMKMVYCLGSQHLHGKILTNHQKAARGMEADVSCLRYKAGTETVDHPSRDCKVSVAVWEGVCRGFTSSNSFKGDLDTWFAENLHNGKLGLVIFLIIWFLLMSCGLFGNGGVIRFLLMSLLSSSSRIRSFSGL